MKVNTVFAIALAIASPGCFAEAVLDQLHGDSNSDLVSTPAFGVDQIFTDFPDYSGAVGDDFTLRYYSPVGTVKGAFEQSNAFLDYRNIKGWQVSFFRDAVTASRSGNSLKIGAEAEAFVTAIITPLEGTHTATKAFEAEANLLLFLEPGKHFVVMAPVLDFSNNGQTYLLSNTSSLVEPGRHNSVGVNPGKGFQSGSAFLDGTNAALEVDVNLVPEPASLIVMGLGVVALLGRRRRL